MNEPYRDPDALNEFVAESVSFHVWRMTKSDLAIGLYEGQYIEVDDFHDDVVTKTLEAVITLDTPPGDEERHFFIDLSKIHHVDLLREMFYLIEQAGLHRSDQSDPDVARGVYRILFAFLLEWETMHSARHLFTKEG